MRATRRYRFIPWMRVLACFAMTLPIIVARSQPARAEEPQAPLNYDELMAQAESKRRAEAHAEAAELLAQAYRARPEGQRSDEIGEVVVRAAMAAYDDALAAEPEGLEQVNAQLELLAQERTLLDEFIRMRTPERSPAAIIRARKELDQRAETLESTRAELAMLQPPHADENDPLAVPPEPPPASDPHVAPEGQDFEDRPRRGRPMMVTGIALMGGGAAGLAMMVSGMVIASNANDFDPSMSLVEREAQLARGARGNRLAVAGAVLGGVLEAAGITLLSIGVARRRGASLVTMPVVGRELVGIACRGRF